MALGVRATEWDELPASRSMIHGFPAGMTAVLAHDTPADAYRTGDRHTVGIRWCCRFVPLVLEPHQGRLRPPMMLSGAS